MTGDGKRESGESCVVLGELDGRGVGGGSVRERERVV